MLALSDSQLLDLWERGVSLHPLDRALLVLRATRGDPEKDLADWPLGRRNQALAEFRCSYFGPNLQAWISCSHCDERLEFEVDVPALLNQQNPQQPSDEPLVINGHSFHLPTSRDLARASLANDPRTAAVALLEACRVERGTSPVWSDLDLDEIGKQLANADPLAEIRLQFNCPMCGNQWEESLDLAAVLWSEIEAQAKRVLLEIHDLASVYGWTEKEILSLSNNRRLLYLEMVRA